MWPSYFPDNFSHIMIFKRPYTDFEPIPADSSIIIARIDVLDCGNIEDDDEHTEDEEEEEGSVEFEDCL